MEPKIFPMNTAITTHYVDAEKITASKTVKAEN